MESATSTVQMPSLPEITAQMKANPWHQLRRMCPSARYVVNDAPLYCPVTERRLWWAHVYYEGEYWAAEDFNKADARRAVALKALEYFHILTIHPHLRRASNPPRLTKAPGGMWEMPYLRYKSAEVGPFLVPPQEWEALAAIGKRESSTDDDISQRMKFMKLSNDAESSALWRVEADSLAERRFENPPDVNGWCFPRPGDPIRPKTRVCTVFGHTLVVTDEFFKQCDQYVAEQMFNAVELEKHKLAVENSMQTESMWTASTKMLQYFDDGAMIVYEAEEFLRIDAVLKGLLGRIGNLTPENIKRLTFTAMAALIVNVVSMQPDRPIMAALGWYMMCGASRAIRDIQDGDTSPNANLWRFVDDLELEMKMRGLQVRNGTLTLSGPQFGPISNSLCLPDPQNVHLFSELQALSGQNSVSEFVPQNIQAPAAIADAPYYDQQVVAPNQVLEASSQSSAMPPVGFTELVPPTTQGAVASASNETQNSEKFTAVQPAEEVDDTDMTDEATVPVSEAVSLAAPSTLPSNSPANSGGNNDDALADAFASKFNPNSTKAEQVQAKTTQNGSPKPRKKFGLNKPGPVQAAPKNKTNALAANQSLSGSAIMGSSQPQPSPAPLTYSALSAPSSHEQTNGLKSSRTGKFKPQLSGSAYYLSSAPKPLITSHGFGPVFVGQAAPVTQPFNFGSTQATFGASLAVSGQMAPQAKSKPKSKSKLKPRTPSLPTSSFGSTASAPQPVNQIQIPPALPGNVYNEEEDETNVQVPVQATAEGLAQRNIKSIRPKSPKNGTSFTNTK